MLELTLTESCKLWHSTTLEWAETNVGMGSSVDITLQCNLGKKYSSFPGSALPPSLWGSFWSARIIT